METLAEEKITTLTKEWMSLITSDHHKDRDCHWYIEKIWNYGDSPIYRIYQNGYILEPFSIECSSLKEAEETLVVILTLAIKETRAWMNHRDGGGTLNQWEWAQHPELHTHFFHPSASTPDRCITCGEWKTKEAEEAYWTDFLIEEDEE